MKFVNLNNRTWQWIFLILLASIWGSSFILMKKGLETFSFYQVAAMRIFISFLFFIPIIVIKIRKLAIKDIKSLLIVGLLGNLIPAFLFTKAQTEINSTLAGMLNSLTPFFTLIVGVLFYGSKTKITKVVGILVGMIGAIGLISGGSLNVFSGNNTAGLFIVLATSFYGISLNEVKTNLKNLDGVSITAFAFLFAGPIAGAYLLFSDFSPALAKPEFFGGFISVALLAILSSGIAAIISNTLIGYTSAIFTSSVTYIIPIFAIFWGFVDGESVTILQILFMTVIFSGVYMINANLSKKVKPIKEKVKI